MVCCMLYVHTMNNIFRSYTMYTSIICRATHIEYKIAIGHCYSYSSVNIYFQWPRQHQSCDFETPQGTAQDWSMLIWITKFLSQKVFRFLYESLMRETDLCLCGNEPAHGGEQIIIIVIVQFNWQEDPVKSKIENGINMTNSNMPKYSFFHSQMLKFFINETHRVCCRDMCVLTNVNSH